MRPALIVLVLLGLVLAATSVAAQGETPRALAQAASSQGTGYGTLRANRRGTDTLTTLVNGTGVTAAEAALRVRVDGDGAGAAVVRVSDVDVLDGLVTARSVRRSSDGTGRVTGLAIEGQAIGTVEDERSYPVTGGTVVVNASGAGLRVRTAAADVRVAIARASTRPFPTPTATPSPTPSPSPTPAPTAAPAPPTAAPTVAPTAVPTSAPERRKAPTVRRRLTRGGYAFPVYGKARVADNFGAARAAPIVSHEGVDIFAPFGSPVVAVQDGRLSDVGTLPISGNRLWLHTANGDAFFYAHLSAFAKAARDGQRVKAGQVLGFTGNTGDAEPTPPHVHFEVHPGGMDEAAVDPYPIVTAWQSRDDVPPGAWLQQLGADATERPGALVTVRDFIAE